MMKKSILTLIALAIVTFGYTQQNTTKNEQKMPLKLNAYAAYVFGNNIDSRYDAFNYYVGKINGAFQWGGGLEVTVAPDVSAELIYLREDTQIPLRYLAGSGTEKRKTFDVGINHIMLGGNRIFRTNNKMLEGYTGASIGALVLGVKNPDAGGTSSKTKFAWGIKAGANVWISPKIGIKIQGQLLSAVQSIGGGLFVGSGGSGVGISTYSSLYQFTLGGGIVLKLN